MPDNEGQQTEVQTGEGQEGQNQNNTDNSVRVPATINKTSQVIHEVIQKQADTNVLFAPFGVDDENVQMYEAIYVGNAQTTTYNASCSLRDFYQEWLAFKKVWKNFIQSADFVKFSSTEPTKEGHVELWYDGDYSESTQSQG